MAIAMKSRNPTGKGVKPIKPPSDVYGSTVPKRTTPTFMEVETTIERLRVDHNFFMDQLSRAVKTLREFLISSDTYTQWRRTRQLNSIRSRLHAVSTRLIAHNHLEEKHVYEWPALMLEATDLSKLHDVLEHQIENLPPRFSCAS